jgi:hypothetical protein
VETGKERNRERMEESTIAKQNKNVPVLPWMRSPVDVSKFEEYPLDILPFLDPRCLSLSLYICINIFKYCFFEIILFKSKSLFIILG